MQQLVEERALNWTWVEDTSREYHVQSEDAKLLTEAELTELDTLQGEKNMPVNFKQESLLD